MILVTLGTIPYPFDRMILWIDTLRRECLIDSPIFVQHGISNADRLQENTKVILQPFVNASEFIQLIDKSNLVISHAGQGTTRLLASRGVKFILVPRLRKYSEHVDDHQYLFCQTVEELGITYCLSLKELKQAILVPPRSCPKSLFEGPKLADYFQKAYP
jgi:UDP-N-acetylglucosamine transferase subunit ALG13